MSEKHPKHEAHEPMHFRCESCDMDERTRLDNTTLFFYTKDKGKTHLKVDCEFNPGTCSRFFLDWTDEELMDWATQFDYYVDENGEIPEYAHQSVELMWKEAHGIKAVPETLAESDEYAVHFMHYLLNTMDSTEIINEMESRHE